MHVLRVGSGITDNAANENRQRCPIDVRESPHAPQLNEVNVPRLHRRTEFVDRDVRVTALMALGSITAAVDNILAVPANPPSVTDASPGEAQGSLRGIELAHFWFDRIAHDSLRPMHGQISLFWYGHFISNLSNPIEPEVAFTRDEVHALDRRRFLQLVGLMGISMDRKVWSQLQKLGTCFHCT